ncbi:MAG: T9SS type A sorting domain-containing protein [Candidatus Symbiothrix sp.]|nr:T9SS type A sorting domain-containing protein [Candidatus Symbiothrix sp.]
MKKTLLLAAALLVSSVSFGQSIAFDSYGNVLLSAYEAYADNQTVTVTVSIDDSNVTGAGWGIGTIKPINSSAPASYEFNSKSAGSAEGTTNTFDFTIAEFKDFAKVDGEYFVDEWEQSGLTINLYNGASLVSITVGAAVEASAVLDFESDALNTTYAASDETTAAVVANPAPTAGNAQSLYYEVTNYNQVISLGTVILPEGSTLADYETITFDVYVPSTQYKELLVKIGESPLWGNGIYKKISKGNAWASLAINLTTGVTTDADGAEFAKEGDRGGTSVYTNGTLNSFELSIGINAAAADALVYYLDNIKFIAKASAGIITVPAVANRSIYPVEGGILVVGNGEKVSVYSIDGRLVKQTPANGSTIALDKGLYIVKTGHAKAEKVVVR